jgi:hypothetical protein
LSLKTQEVIDKNKLKCYNERMSIGKRLVERTEGTSILGKVNFELIDRAYELRRELAAATLGSVLLIGGSHALGENLDIGPMHKSQPEQSPANNFDIDN